MNFDHLKSDGTTGGTSIAQEERSIIGDDLWWPPGSGGNAAGMLVTTRTALQSPAILATLNTIATDVAVLPLCIHQKLANGNRIEATGHAAYELVTRSPDGETTPMKWKQALMGHALAHGNGYAEIQRRGRGSPYALHLLDPEQTQAKRHVDGRLGYSLAGGGWLEAANVIHIAGLGYDGITGYNFIRLLTECIGLSMAAQNYGADFFANGSEPGGVIEVVGKLTSEARRETREEWEAVHGGPGRRHRPAVLTMGTKFNPTSTDPEQSQLLETRKFQVNDVARSWRAPPNKYGDYSQAHLSNIEAANLDYLMTALMGWLTGIEQECNLKLLTPLQWRQGYYFEHLVNALLRGDISSRFAAYEIGVRNGWLSRNEVREKENMNPIPANEGGDIYTVQSQNVPLDHISEPTPIVPPKPKPGVPADAQTEPDPSG